MQCMSSNDPRESRIELIVLYLLSRNTDCDYSSAYVSLFTDSDLVGHGMTFTIGRGNDIVGASSFIRNWL